MLELLSLRAGGGVGISEEGIGIGEGGDSGEGREVGKAKEEDPVGGSLSWARGEASRSSVPEI